MVVVTLVPVTVQAECQTCNQLNFPDVKGHWAEIIIMEAVNNGIVNGFPDGKFYPDAPVEFDQFLKMLFLSFTDGSIDGRVFKEDLLEKMSPFNRKEAEFLIGTGYRFENGQDYWAEPFIEMAINFGIIKEYNNWSNNYSQKLTREDVAYLTYQATQIFLEQDEDEYLTTMIDREVIKDINDVKLQYNKYAIKQLYLKGILNGTGNGYFSPRKELTRAEALTIINRITNKKLRTPYKVDVGNAPHLYIYDQITREKKLYVFGSQHALENYEIVKNSATRTYGTFIYSGTSFKLFSSHENRELQKQYFEEAIVDKVAYDVTVGSEQHDGTIKIGLFPAKKMFEIHEEFFKNLTNSLFKDSNGALDVIKENYASFLKGEDFKKEIKLDGVTVTFKTIRGSYDSLYINIKN